MIAEVFLGKPFVDKIEFTPFASRLCACNLPQERTEESGGEAATRPDGVFWARPRWPRVAGATVPAFVAFLRVYGGRHLGDEREGIWRPCASKDLAWQKDLGASCSRIAAGLLPACVS